MEAVFLKEEINRKTKIILFEEIQKDKIKKLFK